MGSGSWRRRAEPMEADSIVSPLISPSYLGTVVFGLVGGGGLCCLLFASLYYPGFLQLLHHSLTMPRARSAAAEKN